MKRLLLILQILFILVLPVSSMSSLVNAASLDATSFNPLPISVEAKASSGVPIGTVISWPSSTSPPEADTWLDCNGQSISSSTYPELYAIVGSRIPNYQGMFLRGYGSQASAHYNYITHSSGGLNSIQGDAIRNITGSIANSDGYGLFWDAPIEYTGAFHATQMTTTDSRTGPTTDSTQGNYVNFNASNVVPTAQENRPVNMAVRYLIRAR